VSDLWVSDPNLFDLLFGLVWREDVHEVESFYGFVVEILLATSAVRPRADVAYCIHALSRRLAKTRNWTVGLMIMMLT